MTTTYVAKPSTTEPRKPARAAHAPGMPGSVAVKPAVASIENKGKSVPSLAVHRRRIKDTSLMGGPITLIGKLVTAPFQARVTSLREGLDFETVESVVKLLGTTKEEAYRLLAIPTSSLTRRNRQGLRLTTEQSERVLAVADMIAMVERIVRESGNTDPFDAGAWLAQWLVAPNPALADVAPGSYMDTAEGRGMVSGLLGKIQAGVYA